jgi:hypothetical protein
VLAMLVGHLSIFRCVGYTKVFTYP